MNILLLGSGGREHALAWKISQSNKCSKLFIAPGNPGTAGCGTNLPFAVTDFDAITNCCIHEKIDMVIVGPEEPLVKGIYDHLRINPAAAAIVRVLQTNESRARVMFVVGTNLPMKLHNVEDAVIAVDRPAGHAA